MTLLLTGALAVPLHAAEPATAPAGQIDGWIGDAAAAERDGRFAEARTLLEQAQMRAPEDERIRLALARLDALAQGHGNAAPLQPALLAEWARAEIRQGRSRAELMARLGRLADAIEQLEVVREGVRARSLDAQPGVTDDLAALDQTLAGYRRELAEHENAEAKDDRQRRLTEARERVAEDERSGDGRFQARLEHIRSLRSRGHTELALADCRKLVDEEPERIEARQLYGELLAEAHRARQLDHEQALDDVRQELAERLSRTLIPSGFDGMPIYPDDWTRRTHDRAALKIEDEEPAWKTALRDRLRSRTGLDVEAQNGIDVLRSLAVTAGVSIVIDPEIAAGQERTVTLHVPSISVENALSWICREMDTRWTLTSGGIWIGKPPLEEPLLSVYDIATLVYHGMDQPGKVLALSSGGGGGKGGEASAAIFEKSKDEVKPPTPDEVVDLIKASVTPQVWTDERHGITVRGNTLYITAPPDTHRMLREFIRSQESTANLMVKIDTRWLTITDSYLEEIGVEWKTGPMLGFGIGAGGFSRQNANSTFFGTTGNTLPPTAATVQPALETTGLQLNFGYLGFTQVAAVLTAAERGQNGRIVAAPSITTLNGVRSHVFVGEESSYIADYQIVSQNYDPVIRTLITGAGLDVKPFVSADRKYVTMDFRPALTSYRSFIDYIAAPRIVSGNPNANVGTGNGNGQNTVTVSTAAQFPIELPNVKVYEAATTLTVPDRASTLIGGFSRNIDQTADAHVPFLGNIPYLGRLFGRRGRWSEHEKLYLLATITIISYDEQEAKL